MARMSLNRLIGLQLATLVAGFVVLFALFGLVTAVLVLAPGPSAAEYEAALDDLDVPPAWEIAKTTVKATGTLGGCTRFFDGYCPSVTRYSFADGQPSEVFATAKEMLQGAGLTIDREFNPLCDTPPSAPACSFNASSDTIEIDVNVYNPGDGDGLVDERPDRVLVRMTVHRA